MPYGWRISLHRGFYFTEALSVPAPVLQPNPMVIVNPPPPLPHQALDAIPRNDPIQFNEWIQDRRNLLEQKLQKSRLPGVYFFHDPILISSNFPIPGDNIDGPGPERVFLVDLDRMMLFVNGQAICRLDNCPATDIFLQPFITDHYGHETCRHLIPHNFLLPLPVLPAVSQHDIHRYMQFAGTVMPQAQSVAELLSITASPSAAEQVRIRFVEMVIGKIMTDANVSSALRRLETDPDGGDITGSIRSTAISILHFITWPLFYPSMRNERIRKPVKDTFWLRTNMCFLLARHINDDGHLRKAVVDLFHETMSRAEGPREVFGIIFSITHCAIMRIDRSGTGSFTHTLALPFLPSWDTTSAATPGITALARLAHLYDRQHYLRLLMICGIELPHLPPVPLPKTHPLRQFPVEMLLRIIEYLPDTRDVISFGAACSETRASVESIYSGGPVFQDCELLGTSSKDQTAFVPPSERDIQDAAEHGDDIADYEDYRYLTRASFEARHPEKGRVVLTIGLDEYDHSLSGYRKVYFLGHEWKPNATSIDLSYQLSDMKGHSYGTEVKKWYFGTPAASESAEAADDVNGSDGEDSDVDMDGGFDAPMQGI